MIDKTTVEHIAKLARLSLSDKEAAEYSTQLSKILGYFEQIAKIDTKEIDPLVTPTDVEEFWREDAVKHENTAEEMVANAPQKTGHLFTVPPVV